MGPSLGCLWGAASPEDLDEDGASCGFFLFDDDDMMMKEEHSTESLHRISVVLYSPPTQWASDGSGRDSPQQVLQEQNLDLFCHGRNSSFVGLQVAAEHWLLAKKIRHVSIVCIVQKRKEAMM